MPTPVPAPGSPREIAQRMAEQGELAQAVRWLESALEETAAPEERQDLAAGLAELARSAEAAGELDAAQRALEAATRVVEWADLFCRLGSLNARRGRRSEARSALDRALAINPRYRTAIVERALLDAREGRIAEAMQTLRVLAADSTLTEPGAFREGLEHLSQAAFEDAAPLLRRALPGGDGWLEGQLRHYQERLFADDMPGGLAVLRDAAEQRPGYPDLQLLLGAHERRMGSYDDALASVTFALELNPDYHAARVELARTLEMLGDTPQSLRQLELVLTREPGQHEALALQELLTSRRPAGRA
jgi:tetratricopeptide (TPR) repeat protein